MIDPQGDPLVHGAGGQDGVDLAGLDDLQAPGTAESGLDLLGPF